MENGITSLFPDRANGKIHSHVSYILCLIAVYDLTKHYITFAFDYIYSKYNLLAFGET